MYIAHKSNVVQAIHDVEWECRKKVKGLTTSEYWPWLATITTGDPHPVVDYSGETGYTIVKCTDEDVHARLVQLSDYQAEGVYNIKWSDTKTKVTVDEVEIETHFVGDDSAKDARILADKWANVRKDRNRKLTETDYLALSDNTLSDAMKTYRQDLRDVPTQSDPDNITWPSKP
tara:strand:+ start:163 stop:684 length:522 start_codon:yes stop_codon:yes gene_type:complete